MYIYTHILTAALEQKYFFNIYFYSFLQGLIHQCVEALKQNDIFHAKISFLLFSIDFQMKRFAKKPEKKNDKAIFLFLIARSNYFYLLNIPGEKNQF